VISLVAGGFLLVYTDLSLTLLVVFVGVWLIVKGFSSPALSQVTTTRKLAEPLVP